MKRRERHRVWETLRLSNVEVFRGSGRFEGPHAVSVSNGSEEPVLLTGEKILIATGSSPVHPPGFEFEDPRVHDSDEILELDRVPASLAVVGAGVIGSEYACTFAALGVEVHLIDGRDRLLPFLDVDISNALEKAMRGLGVEFHWKEQVLECSTMDPDQVELACSSGRRFRLDGVLVAAGRKSNTASLNLEAAGIEPGPRGVIVVDSAFRTSVHHIYAAGDVIGFPALASTSSEQARFAMAHAFDPNLELTLAPLLPTGIYTIPEVSMVGETEASLKKQGVDYIAAVAPYSENSRGGIVGDRTGLLKLLFRRGDLKLLGVHAIGEQATELVHIGLMAMLTGQTAKIFVEACFNVPTLGDLYKQAALKAVMAEHLQPVAVA
ncbi:MAG TPA: Si-specific NAD(P)(+) transhydrogenase [Solibacterales bacterium]|nr:Si-specific NAD(P)(+) transhydrogenase [Bryobacterales bacterium]